MCERLPLRTPSVMTGGCCSSSRRSGTAPARRSSTSAFCITTPLPYGTRPRRRTSSGRASAVIDVEVLQVLLDIGHELIGNGAVDDPVIVAKRQIGHRPDP